MSGITILPGRTSPPGKTAYGYDWQCHDPKAEHGHGMYGQCHIPATKADIDRIKRGIERSLANDKNTYERTECWCRLEIVRSGPRNGWQHVNTKKQNHPARPFTGKRRVRVKSRLATGRLAR